MQNKEHARMEGIQFYIVIRQILNTDLKELKRMATQMINGRAFQTEGRTSERTLRVSLGCSGNTTEVNVAEVDSVKQGA